jgi:CBS domain-containing protein
MPMLSQLGRVELVDKDNNKARVDDLVIDLFADDYPPVTALLFTAETNRTVVLPWEAVEHISLPQKQFRVSSLNQARPISDEQLKKAVLLKRDILDAMVLDLQNRRATRANDLWLEEDNSKLILRAADTSIQAIFRRLTRSLVGKPKDELLYDWKYVEFLRGDVQAAREGAYYHKRLSRLLPGEIALLSEALPYLHAAELLTLLPDDIAADTLEMMTAARQRQVFEELEEGQALRLLELMAPNTAADLLSSLHTQITKSYLEQLPQRQRERIIELLRYPEGTIGAIMTNDFVYASADLTVQEAREELRERLENPDFVYFIYIVEDEKSRLLRGVLTLRDLISADEDKRLREIMNPYLLILKPLAPVRDAAYKIINNNIAALPVINNEGKLIGIVTVDAATAQIAPENWRSQMPKVFS